MSTILLTRPNPTNTATCDEIVQSVNGVESTARQVACPTSAPGSATGVPVSQTQSVVQPASLTSTLQAVKTGDNANGNGSTTPFTQPSAQSSVVTSIGSALPTSLGNTTASAVAQKKGLEGGAVAGVAIGMLLAGALIAGIIFFFLLRRQKRRQVMSAPAYSRQHASYTERNIGPEKGATVVAASVGSIDDLLPQPAEDDAITGDLSKIRDNVKNHVRTYYHSGPISATDVNEAGIRDVAALTGLSAVVIVKALSDPVTRDSALRSIIGSVILTRCTGERSPNLLPNEVAALSTFISLNSGNSSQSVLFSKWKTITGALLLQRYGKQSQDPSRIQSFQDTVASLDSILAPFVKGSVDGGQRRKNLDMILSRAANFAFLLFAQPGTFRFEFASHQGGLTVFPALVQTVGDQGQPLSPIKVLTEKEVVAA